MTKTRDGPMLAPLQMRCFVVFGRLMAASGDSVGGRALFGYAIGWDQ